MRAITGEGGGAGGGTGGGVCWARTARLEPAITPSIATMAQPDRRRRPVCGSSTIKISSSRDGFHEPRLQVQAEQEGTQVSIPQRRPTTEAALPPPAREPFFPPRSRGEVDRPARRYRPRVPE